MQATPYTPPEQPIDRFNRGLQQGGLDVIMDGLILEKPLTISNPLCRSIQFINVTFQAQVEVIDVNNADLFFTFDNCHVETKLSFYNCQSKSISLDGCEMECFRIDDSTFKNITIAHNTLKESWITDVKVESILFTSNKDCNLVVENCNIINFDISDNSGSTKIDLAKDPIVENQKYELVIYELTIETQSDFNGNISIRDYSIDTLNLYGRLDKGTIEIADLDVKECNVQRFINYGVLKVSNIQFVAGDNESILSIANSDLGKTILFDIDFNEVDNISITTINLREIITSGVIWCDQITYTEDNKMSFGQLRQVYNQLKNVCAKQNNKPDELRFKSLELSNYKKELAQLPKTQNDQFVLWFSNVTNRYGQSWMQPFVIIFCTVLIGFTLIKGLLGFWHWDLNQTTNTLSEFAECFNPVRKFNDTFGPIPKNVSSLRLGGAKLIDIVVLRLFVGLLLYQMVQAFRKYAN